MKCSCIWKAKAGITAILYQQFGHDRRNIGQTAHSMLMKTMNPCFMKWKGSYCSVQPRNLHFHSTSRSVCCWIPKLTLALLNMPEFLWYKINRQNYWLFSKQLIKRNRRNLETNRVPISSTFHACMQYFHLPWEKRTSIAQHKCNCVLCSKLGPRTPCPRWN